MRPLIFLTPHRTSPRHTMPCRATLRLLPSSARLVLSEASMQPSAPHRTAPLRPSTTTISPPPLLRSTVPSSPTMTMPFRTRGDIWNLSCRNLRRVRRPSSMQHIDRPKFLSNSTTHCAPPLPMPRLLCASTRKRKLFTSPPQHCVCVPEINARTHSPRPLQQQRRAVRSNSNVVWCCAMQCLEQNLQR